MFLLKPEKNPHRGLEVLDFGAKVLRCTSWPCKKDMFSGKISQVESLHWKLRKLIPKTCFFPWKIATKKLQKAMVWMVIDNSVLFAAMKLLQAVQQ